MNRAQKTLLLFLILFLSFLLSINLGSSDFNNLLFKFIFDSSQLSHAEISVLRLRLDRSLSCVFVGSSLAFCGFLFQNLLKNPLAESFTMGFSGAAALGISVAILFHFFDGILGPVLFGFLFCLGAGLVVVLFKEKMKWGNSKSLILIGISIGFFCNSLSLLIQSLLNAHELQYSFSWMIGSFDSLRNQWWHYALLLNIILILYATLRSKQLDLLLLHKDTAKSFGLNSKKIEKEIFFLGAIVCGICVSISGIIAFVGLLSPHLSRRISKSSLTKANLFFSLGIGANLVLLSDIIARLLSNNTQVPTGGIIALLGAPFFAYLILNSNSTQKAKS